MKLLETLPGDLCSDEQSAALCVHSLLIKTNICRNRREFDAGKTFLKQGLDHADRYLDSENPLLVQLLVENAYLESETGTHEAALDYALQALRIVENSEQEARIEAVARLAAGFLYFSRGNYNTAISHYSAALDALEESERTVPVINVLAQTHNNIGITYRRLGDIDRAMEHYRQNLDLVREVFGDDHLELAYAFNSIGTVYYIQGDYGTAGDYFQRSAAIFRSSLGENSTRYAAAVNNAGISYFRLGDLDQAARLFETAQHIKEQTLGENHPETAVGYTNLANVYMENRNFEAALENYLRSISVRINTYGPDHPDLVTPYIQLGEYYIETGDYRLAREQFYESLRIIQARISQNHPDIWEIRLDIGRSYLEEGRYTDAKIHFNEALRLMTEASGIDLNSDPDFTLLTHPLPFLNALRQSGDLHLKFYHTSRSVNDLRAAFHWYELATGLIDFLQFRYQNESSKLNLVDQNYSIYTRAIETCYFLFEETGNEQWLEEMLHLSELSRSRIALELLQEMDARSFAGVPDDVLDEEQKINREITGLYQKMSAEQEKGDSSDSALIARYRDSLFYLNDELKQFTEKLETRYPAYHQLKYDRNLAGHRAISKLLAEDETMVQYVVGEEDLFVLLVDRENIRTRKIEMNIDLPQTVRSLRRAVITDSTEAIMEQGHALYRQLVEPYIREVSTPAMIIVPDQALHFLPFEMLLTGQPDNDFYPDFPYLIKQKRIMYTPSATVLQRMTDRRTDRTRNLLALAPFHQTDAVELPEPDSTTYDPGRQITPLPLTRYETREIGKLFRERRSLTEFFYPNHTDILLDQFASKEFVMTHSLDDYSFIHFATHAYIDENQPELSGIVFRGDGEENGTLYVNDIYNLQLKADLVVLGACETGLGTSYRGEGLIGFTRAFIHAGAANMIVSSWRVNDQSTADLMIRFYRYVRDGYSYSESLHQAKMDLISHPDYAQPESWAAFILQGR